MSRNYKKNFTGLCLVLPIVLLLGCGEDDAKVEIIEEEPVVVKIGVFKDSAVSGISYSTATQSGVTNSSGAFNYIEGETITFSIGSIILPSTIAKFVLTPIELVGDGADITNNTVTNISRFLQTLDSDNDTAEGIDIEQATIEAAINTSIDFTDPDFGETGSASLAFIDSLERKGADGEDLVMVDAATARAHLSATITVIGQSQFTEDFLASRTFSVTHEAGTISELYFRPVVENTTNTGTMRFSSGSVTDTFHEITSWSVTEDGNLIISELNNDTAVPTTWEFSESSVANNIANYTYEQPDVVYESGTGTMVLLENIFISSFLEGNIFAVDHDDSTISELDFNSDGRGFITYLEGDEREVDWSIKLGVLTITETNENTTTVREWTFTATEVTDTTIEYSFTLTKGGTAIIVDNGTMTL